MKMYTMQEIERNTSIYTMIQDLEVFCEKQQL